MQDFQKRVIDEQVQLSDKLTKLKAFFLTDAFQKIPSEERDRLLMQSHFMDGYNNILLARIEAFE